MSSYETVDPRLQAHRRLFYFVVTNMMLQGLPHVIGWMPLGPLRIGVTAAVIGVAVLIAPLVLQKVRESSDGSTEVAGRLRLLALIYAGLLVRRGAIWACACRPHRGCHCVHLGVFLVPFVGDAGVIDVLALPVSRAGLTFVCS